MASFKINENKIVVSVVSFIHPDYLYSERCTLDSVGMIYDEETDSFIDSETLEE